MKRRLLSVFGLVLVFVLAMSTVAMAATGTEISNKLQLDVTVNAGPGTILEQINSATTSAEMQTLVVENAGLLEIDLTSYGKLIEARKPSVFVDLLSNRPDSVGYTLGSLKTYFNAIVETRHVTQASMDWVNEAESIAELEEIKYVEMLLGRFIAADEVYDIHSGIPLSEKIATLQALVDRYNALNETDKGAVLAWILNKKPDGGYARSQATTDELAHALDTIAPTIALVGLSGKSAEGTYDAFTMNVYAGGKGTETVRVLFEASASTGFTLKSGDSELSFIDGKHWFGSEQGQELRFEKDRDLRVTWTDSGTYTFKVSIWAGEATLAEATGTVVVTDVTPIVLTHKLGGTPTGDSLTTTTTEGTELDYTVTAALAEGVDHVDGVLYVCEVLKKGEGGTYVAASTDDFMITKMNGSTDTQGVNSTFVQDGDVLRGYWGPLPGFTLNGSLTTIATVKFNNTGTYRVVIYAIQVN